MFDDEIQKEPTLDMAEIYRQHYEDALEEIYKLREALTEVTFERDLLKHQLGLAEDHILKYGLDEED